MINKKKQIDKEQEEEQTVVEEVIVDNFVITKTGFKWKLISFLIATVVNFLICLIIGILFYIWSMDDYRVKTDCNIVFNNGTYITIEYKTYQNSFEFSEYNSTQITCYYTEKQPSNISIYLSDALYNDKYEPLIYFAIIVFGISSIFECIILNIFACIVCLKK